MFELKQVSQLVNPHLGKAPTPGKARGNWVHKGHKSKFRKKLLQTEMDLQRYHGLPTIPCLIVMSLNLVFFP